MTPRTESRTISVPAPAMVLCSLVALLATACSSGRQSRTADPVIVKQTGLIIQLDRPFRLPDEPPAPVREAVEEQESKRSWLDLGKRGLDKLGVGASIGSPTTGTSPAPAHVPAPAPAPALVENVGAGIAGPFYDVQVGAGLVMLVDHEEGRVEDASVRKGKVRIDEAATMRLGIMLEAHYLYPMGPVRHVGHGPFAGVVGTSGDIVDAVMTGYMVSLRGRDGGRSFNVTFGLYLDPNAKVMADGFEEGSNAPTSGGVLFKKEPMVGYALGVTYGF